MARFCTTYALIAERRSENVKRQHNLDMVELYDMIGPISLLDMRQVFCRKNGFIYLLYGAEKTRR